MNMEKLNEINDFYEYLDALASLKDCYIILAACDTMTPSPQRTNISESGYEKLRKLGIKLLRADNAAEQFWCGYVAVLYNGDSVYEFLGSRDGNVRYDFAAENFRINVLSSPYKMENRASVLINGKENAVNARGMNFVVYDKANDKVLDSVCFDTWAERRVASRKIKTKISLSSESQKNHYDVGIYGLWYGSNYGSIITYFALDNVVRSLGYSTVMIKNPLGNENSDYSTLRRSHSLLFADKHYKITPKFKIDKMSGLNEICGSFLLGSDQMWNYNLSKPYKQTYFFDFVNDDNKKIAYATSFGKDKYIGPDSEKLITKKNLERFDAVSVRDDFSKRILQDEFGIKAEILLDPVFLCPREKYEGLIDEAELKIDEKFIFAYILDPNPETGKSLTKISEKSGLKIFVIFNEGSDKETAVERLKVDKSRFLFLTEATVEEWLYCFKNSEMVITDSFHGCCFSVIFRKNFIVKKNMGRGGGRFDYLTNILKLRNYMTETSAGFDELFDKFGIDHVIDYTYTEKKLKEEYIRSRKWLKDALELPKKKLPSVLLPDKTVSAKLDKNSCTGCGACVSACPFGALTLKSDEYGYYRSDIDYDKCINCGKCVRVCAAIDLPQKTNFAEPDCYAFIAADKKQLYDSSSGAIFPLLAEKVIDEGGVAAGAAWTDDFTVEHILAESSEDLEKLKKSKYLQSYMGDIDKRIKAELDKGRKVLFSGCPCQVAGLKKYLGREYPNLILVDLLCGNAPSGKFFKAYLEESFPQGVKDYQFRYKKQGWNADCLTLTLTDGTKIERRGSRQDIYQKAYHSHLMCPPHCEHCKYQSAPRFGDITIGDFWGYSKRDASVDTSEGISAVLCNNDKGRNFFEKIPDEYIKVKKLVPFEWLGGNGYALPGKHNWKSPARDDFYAMIKNHPFSEAVEKALAPEANVKDRPIKGFSPLEYDSYVSRFRYDSEFWEEHIIDGKITLLARKEKSEPGKFAFMQLRENLKKDQKYRLKIRFKANTASKRINLHIVDSKSPKEKLQIVKACINENGFNNAWVEEEVVFTAKNEYYNGFGIGALQFSGPNAYFMVDYVAITEEK